MRLADTVIRVIVGLAAAWIGLSVITVTLIGRPQDATTAAITTAVVMIVAEVARTTPGGSPSCGWPTPRSGSSWASPPRGSA